MTEPSVEIMREGPGGILERAKALELSAQEIAAQYEVVGQTEHAVLVTAAEDPVLQRTSPRPDLRELGTTGQSLYSQVMREDYNSDFHGDNALRIYDKMRKHAHVKAALRLVKTPILGARWYVDSPGEADINPEIIRHIHLNLFHWMTTSFVQFLYEALLMLDFGYYVFEKVYAFRDERVVWQKFAPRHPYDIVEWDFDRHGGPKRAHLYPLSSTSQERWININKLLVFTNELEAGNIYGESILRPAYPHWFYQHNLYKIDAIQKERHGIGIPVIKLPANFDVDDKNLANEIGRNLRSNEKAYVTLPPNWEILTLKLEGQTVNALESAKHHGDVILLSVLGQFLYETSQASQEKAQDLFLKATRYVADNIRDVINKHAIPQLVFWNWGEQEAYPELKVRRIGDTIDWRTISFALRNLIGAKVIQPDDELEKWAREEMDLPKVDTTTTREIVPDVEDTISEKDPAQPLARQPRQSDAPGMRQQARGQGSRQTGNDTSGG